MSARGVSGTALLDSLPATERELVQSRMEDVSVDAGEALAKTGDFGWAMYTIVEGEVEVRSADGVALATLGPGDVFGEVALLRAGRRMADVVARTPSRLNALFTRDFLQIRDQVPVFEEELRALIDARLAAGA